MSLIQSMRDVGRPVAYYPRLSRFFGSVNAAIFFSQLAYWQDRSDSPLGVYKTADEWEDETGLSYREQTTARRLLCAPGYLIETHRRLEHRVYYRLDLDVIDAAFGEWSMRQSASDKTARPGLRKPHAPDCANRISPNAENAVRGVRKPQSVSKTEITAETTAETTADISPDATFVASAAAAIGADLDFAEQAQAQAQAQAAAKAAADQLASEQAQAARLAAEQEAAAQREASEKAPEAAQAAAKAQAQAQAQVPAKAEKPAKTIAADETALQAACKAAWHAYSAAYGARYSVLPVRNARVNSAIRQIVRRIGYDEAPAVASFFVTHVNEALVVRNCHDIGLLLRGVEAYRTQWATGQAVTQTRAHQADQSSANYSAAAEAVALLRARRAARAAQTENDGI